MINLKLNKKKFNLLLNKDLFLKICLLISSFNICLWFFKKFIFGDREPFWDMIINYCAGQAYINNINPYEYGIGINPLRECLSDFGNMNDGFVYVSTVILVKLSSLFSLFDIEVIKNFWYLISIFSLIVIIFTSKNIYKEKINYYWYSLILFFSFGGIYLFSYLTGNISLLAATIISIGIYFYKKRKINTFCILVCLAATLRPQFFLFILLPFMQEKREYFFKIIIFSFMIISIFLYDFFLNKELFYGFLKGLAYVRSDSWFFTFGDGIGLDAIIDQLPYAIISYFDIYVQPGPSKYSNIIWLILASTFLIGTYVFLRKENNLKKININEECSLALGVIIITACLPRLQMYDLILAIPATYCLGNNLMLKKEKLVSLFGFIILIFMFAVHDLNAPIFIFFTIFLYFYLKNFKKINI